MPPKKAAAAKAPAVHENGEVKFAWTPENERRLLLLAARSSIGGADYREFVKAMPPGVSYEGLRQKFQKLRREQKGIYDKMGWTLSDSCPSTTSGAAPSDTPKSATTNGKKRSVDGDAEDEDETAANPKPAKKAWAKKQTPVEGADGEEAAEKPAKKPARGRGRPKKAAVAEIKEEEAPTFDDDDHFGVPNDLADYMV